MVKPYKVLSKASMAAVIAASAIVPAATASAADVQKEVEYVVFEKDGQLLKLTLDDYAVAYTLGKINKTEQVKYVQDTKGTVYLLDDYAVAYTLTNKDVDKAFDRLAKENKEVKVDNVADGKIVDGKVVGDETSEEKVNETFFYNLAA